VVVLAAADAIRGPGGPLAVILGAAVVLLLAGAVVAVLAHRGRRTRRSPPPAVAGTPVPAADEQPLEQPAPLPPEAACEPCLLAPETIAPLARTLERSRRLWVSGRQVLAVLEALPRDRWLVEEDVIEGSRRIPFVVAGPSGVFVVGATDGPWTIPDLQGLTTLADRLQRQLPGWKGEIQVVMCVAFETTEIRSWRGGPPEAPYRGWVVGANDLPQWLMAFESEHGGLQRGDIRRLDEEGLPLFEQRAARLPRTPNYG
jgi:hypothetical protein